MAYLKPLLKIPYAASDWISAVRIRFLIFGIKYSTAFLEFIGDTVGDMCLPKAMENGDKYKLSIKNKLSWCPDR